MMHLQGPHRTDRRHPLLSRALVLVALMLVTPLFGALHAPDSGNEEIIWRANRRLSWDDFRGRPDRAHPMDALTESGISFSWSCDHRGFEVEVQAIFVPGQSWVKENPTPELLAHEQTHFDITEIHARKLRKRFAEMGNPCALGRRGIDNVAKQYYQESRQMQEQYDRETRHGELRQQQLYWQKKVASQLKSLDRWAI